MIQPSFNAPSHAAEPGHVFFISVRSLLCAHAMPESQAREFVRSVPAETVATFKPCLDSARAEYSSSIVAAGTDLWGVLEPERQLSAVQRMQRTPVFVPANGHGGASKGGDCLLSDVPLAAKGSDTGAVYVPGTAPSSATSASFRQSCGIPSTPVMSRTVMAFAANAASPARCSAAEATEKEVPPGHRLLCAWPVGSSAGDPRLEDVGNPGRQSSADTLLVDHLEVRWHHTHLVQLRTQSRFEIAR